MCPILHVENGQGGRHTHCAALEIHDTRFRSEPSAPPSCPSPSERLAWHRAHLDFYSQRQVIFRLEVSRMIPAVVTNSTFQGRDGCGRSGYKLELLKITFRVYRVSAPHAEIREQGSMDESKEPLRDDDNVIRQHQSIKRHLNGVLFTANIAEYLRRFWMLSP